MPRTTKQTLRETHLPTIETEHYVARALYTTPAAEYVWQSYSKTRWGERPHSVRYAATIEQMQDNLDNWERRKDSLRHPSIPPSLDEAGRERIASVGEVDAWVQSQKEIYPKEITAALRVLESASTLLREKNAGYARAGASPFSNFLESSPVQKGLLSPIQYAHALCAKQDDAAGNQLAAGGGPDLRERLMDGLVYRAIMIAMLDMGVSVTEEVDAKWVSRGGKPCNS